MPHLLTFLFRGSKWVVAVSVALSMIGGYFTLQLYKNLRTDIEELLPTSSRSIVDLTEVTHRINSVQNLVVLLFSKDTQASKRFAIDLGSQLDRVDKNVISSVEYRIDRELAFFKKRQALYLSVEDLRTIKNYVIHKIQYERDILNPLNIFSGAQITEPQFNFFSLEKKYQSKTQGFDAYPGGFYATPDEKLRLMVVNMPGKGLDTAHRLKDEVLHAVSSLNPRSYAPDLEVKYTSNVEDMIEESSALVEDLMLSTLLVTLIVTGLMLIYYGSLWATVALLASLIMGTLWSFGVSYWVVGYLNANTAFLGSIVFGNGINFGIILLARYLEERRGGGNHSEAIQSAVKNTYRSTGTAALAAGLSYGSLMTTQFRGFSQFGIIGFIGMILCWVSAYVTLPAILTVLDQSLGNQWINLKPKKAWVTEHIAKWIARFPGVIWYTCLAGLIASVMMFPRIKEGVILNDLNKLRDKECMLHGSGSLYHYIHDVFRFSVDPVYILPRTREDTRKIAENIREDIRKLGPESMIDSVQTLDDFIPDHQSEKIELIKEIKENLPDKLISRLSPEEKARIHELLTPEVMEPFGENDLPQLVLNKFREKDGSVGKIILVNKVYNRYKDDIEVVAKFVNQARESADHVAPGTPVAGQLMVSYDLFHSIQTDGPKATLLAFLAVCFLVVLLFRETLTIFQVLMALLIGMVWMVGIILGFGLKINFLNFIALPITFGIGIDYGVNIFQRYREVGKGGIIKVVSNSGGAVFLSSLTTITGYSSLLIAGNQAFVSFGVLAVLGEIACVTAAVIALPAFLAHFDLRRAKGRFLQENSDSQPEISSNYT